LTFQNRQRNSAKKILWHFDRNHGPLILSSPRRGGLYGHENEKHTSSDAKHDKLLEAVLDSIDEFGDQLLDVGTSTEKDVISSETDSLQENIVSGVEESFEDKVIIPLQNATPELRKANYQVCPKYSDKNVYLLESICQSGTLIHTTKLGDAYDLGALTWEARTQDRVAKQEIC